ncbi:DUF58 domain-containing protein [Arthrobacter sp. MDT3-24]
MSQVITGAKSARAAVAAAARGASSGAAAARRRIGTALSAVSRYGAPIGRIAGPFVSPAAAAAARLLKVPTSFGWAVMGVAALSATGAVAWGWQELNTWTFIAVALVVVALPFVLGKLSYRVTLDLARNRVVVGERAVGRVDVENTAKHRLLPARIELPVGQGLASFHLPGLDSGETHEELFTIPTNRRTVLSVGPVRSIRGDALGLLRRQLAWTEAVPLFVHPRTTSLSNSSSGLFRDLDGLPTKDLASDDISFHALREYVPGDDRRYIHWKSSARTGKLMVRQFEETRRSHLAVALSTNPEHYQDDVEFELAISVCGSIALQSLREEKEVTVVTHDNVVPSPTGKRLLDGLAAVDAFDAAFAKPRHSAPGAFAQKVATDVANASVITVIFGGRVDMREIQAAIRKIPHGVRTTVIRCVRDEELGLRSIAGASMLTLGHLEDLSRGVRRVGE